MIHHTCFKCKRRFELDPTFVGFELRKLNKTQPNYYQAVCPACRAVNKVSVPEMQSELDGVTAEVDKMMEEYQQTKARARAEKKAKAAAQKAED